MKEIIEILDGYHPGFPITNAVIAQEIEGLIEQKKKFAWTQGASHAANVRFRQRFEIAGRLFTEWKEWFFHSDTKLNDLMIFPDWLSQQDDK